LQRIEKQLKTDPPPAKGLKYGTIMPLRISPAASRNADYPRSATVCLIFSHILYVNFETNQHFFGQHETKTAVCVCVQQVWAPSRIVGHCSGDNEDIAVFRDVPMPSVVEKHP